MMWRSTLSIALSVVALLSLGAVQVAVCSSECVELTGIEPGGGEGILDLDEMLISFEKEPFDLSNPLITTVAGCSSQLETPIYMRALLGIDTAAFSVSSMFHTNGVALDVFGDKNTSDARRRCQPCHGEDSRLFDLHLRVAIIYTFVYAGYLYMPYCLESLEPLMEERNHTLSLLLDADEEPTVDTPWGLAKAYVDEIFDFMMKHDGWNADGSASSEFNRVPFSDYAIRDSAGNSWKPFVPANSPYKIKDKRKWQALSVSNGLGYTSIQRHITPHIGATARYFGFNSTEDEAAYAARKAEDPRYSYRDQVKTLIEDTAITSTDSFKMNSTSFFDNKFTSLIPLKIAFFTRPETTWLTALDFYRLTLEVQLAMYNGVILCWKEKIRWNMPRPQTVAKIELGDRLVNAYARSEGGVRLMKASEWESIISTMAHSEYPSASSCLCRLYAEQVSHSLENDAIEPPLQFPWDNYTFEFTSWSEIGDVCGDSRVWGGLHFEAAVSAGVELCGDFLVADSISATVGRLVHGDETAAIFDRNVGELMVRRV